MSITARALHGVNVCLIPSPYNDDRPLLLRHKPLAAISSALLLIKALAILAIILAPTPAELSTITADRVIQLTNAEREKVGLQPLTKNSKLTAAAVDKGNNMLEQDYFAHISPTGVTPWFWIQKYGYDYAVAGENLAIDFVDVEDVVAAWMASPSHKENILRPDYTETGVAVVTGEFQGGTSTVVVHMFGKPAVASETTVAPSPTPATAGIQQTKPTPAPASPTPTPTPAPSVPVPRIAVVGGLTVQNTATVSVTGTPGATITLLVNGEVDTTKILEGDTATISIDASSLPEGEFSVRGYETAEGGVGSSELSDALAFYKDTTGPSVDLASIAFAINPLFDTQQAAAAVPNGDSARIETLGTGTSESLTATDEFGNATALDNISLTPTFKPSTPESELSGPRRMAQLSRQISVVVLTILLTLLSVAILVRVRTQHPALIAHASFVILLAGALFLI